MAGGMLISNALDQNLGDKIMNKRIRLLILTSFVYASPGLAEEQGKPASLAAQGSASPAAAVP